MQIILKYSDSMLSLQDPPTHSLFSKSCPSTPWCRKKFGVVAGQEAGQQIQEALSL